MTITAKYKIKARQLVFGLLLFVPMLSLGQERSDLLADFKKTYAEYEQNIAALDFRKALPSAKTSLELGEQLFEPGGENLIRLQHNLGLILMNLEREEDARAPLKDALQNSEKLYGEGAPELIEILVDYWASLLAPFHFGSEKKYFQKALKISKKAHGANSLEYGELNIRIGNQITYKTHTREGKKYIDRGVRIIEKAAGTNSRPYANAAFHRGKIEIATRDYKSAAKYFEQALQVFDNPGEPEGQMQLSTHAFLVNSYENLGDKERATKHCLAIGRMTPAREKQEFLPVFRAKPVYPSNALTKGMEGWVDLMFDVNESGFTQHSKVTASSSEIFHKASLKAVQGYRYAPAFEGGEPVVTKDVEIRIWFKMAN